MLVTIAFIVFAGLHALLYHFLDSYRLQTLFTGINSPWNSQKPRAIVTKILSYTGLPWGLLIVTGTLWGFSERPYPSLLLSPGSDSTILFVAIVIALAYSYAVSYRLGHMRGYREGREQVLSVYGLKESQQSESDTRSDVGGH